MADSDSKSLTPSAPAPPWMIVTFFLTGVGIVLAALFTDFAALVGWVGLGPGPRQFSGSTSFMRVSSSSAWSPSAGRIVFATIGILVSIVALLAWVSAAKALVRRLSAEADRPS